MRSTQVLGLDLGTHAFKLVRFEAKDGKLALKQAKLVALPAPADPKGHPEVLRSLLGDIPALEFAQVVSVIDDPVSCVREITIPPMPAGEIVNAIQWELQRFMTASPEEVTIDYQPLGEIEVEGAKKQRILAVAIPTEAIQTHLALLGEAGLSPTRLVPKSIAVAQWMDRLDLGQKRSVGVLDLGSCGSEFMVVRNGTPFFTRKIPVGGQEITRSMTGVLMTDQGQVGLSEAQAEELKRRIGIPKPESAQILQEGISEVQLLSLMRGSIERLVTEVERSITFHDELPEAQEIGELVLMGGGAHMKGLAPWLGERLGVRVSVPNPLEELQVSGDDALGQEVTEASCTLIPVLGAVLQKEGGINLLPREIKEAVKIKLQHAALKGMLTAAILMAALCWVGIQTHRQSLQKQITALGVEMRAMAQELPAARAIVAAQARLHREPDWEGLFRELSCAVPSEAYLTELGVQEQRVMLRGRVRKLNRPPEDVSSELMRRLRDGIFTDVQLRSSRQTERSGEALEFEIECRLE